ncbi:MAG: glycosyltransferase [Anaerolineae bacterium]|nr:glycosyltransferase [Anaerolineae bacterium]
MEPSDSSTRLIRILYVIGQMSYGGAERQLIELCKGLNPMRYALSVCSLTPKWTMFDRYQLPHVDRIVCYKRAGMDPAIIFRLARIMYKGNYDIVHTWLYTANTWGRVAARLAGVPVVIGSLRVASGWQNRFRTFMSQCLVPLVDVMVANAQAVRDSDASTLLIRPEYEVIYNGVDTKRFLPVAPKLITQTRSSLRLPENGPLIGTVGRFDPQKDYRTWLQMASHVQASLPGARFVIVGDGEFRRAIEAWIVELGLENNVMLLGSRPDIENIMPVFDVFVLSSRYEGLPNVILEAMSCGVPVVATSVDGTVELVHHNETGLLVKPHDALALAEAVLRILSNPEKARKMGQAGRSCAEDLFSLERMVTATDALYSRLLFRKGISIKAL